jgi:hypothetical protein
LPIYKNFFWQNYTGDSKKFNFEKVFNEIIKNKKKIRLEKKNLIKNNLFKILNNKKLIEIKINFKIKK